MTGRFAIDRSERSTCAVKVRAWSRCKGLPHRGRLRRGEARAGCPARAKLLMIPLLPTPEDTAWLQDATSIVETPDHAHSAPSIHPDEPMGGPAARAFREAADRRRRGAAGGGDPDGALPQGPRQ